MGRSCFLDMKRTIDIADSTLRAYRKKNLTTVLHLRTFLVVNADSSFRDRIKNTTPIVKPGEPLKPWGISAFFTKHPTCKIQIPQYGAVEGDVSFACLPEMYTEEVPSGEKWVTYKYHVITSYDYILFRIHVELNIGRKPIYELSIGNITLNLFPNFPGRPAEKKIVIKKTILTGFIFLVQSMS